MIGFQATGKGAHGLYISRDSTRMFVTNRDGGSITVVNLATRKPAATWVIAGGGSPDMGNVSADGTVLWLSGRYNGVVYALSTTDGHLIAKIPVGSGPHGLCVWPIPGATRWDTPASCADLAHSLRGHAGGVPKYLRARFRRVLVTPVP